jgi:hypothetical protein
MIIDSYLRKLRLMMIAEQKKNHPEGLLGMPLPRVSSGFSKRIQNYRNQMKKLEKVLNDYFGEQKEAG